MITDPKKTASVILSRMKGATPPEPEAEPEGDTSDEGLKAAAEEAIKAIHEKNPDGFVSAMKSFMDQCESEPEGD